MDRNQWIEYEIEKYEADYGELPAHNRSILRGIKQREYEFWERESARVDSNNNHDDQ